MQELVITYSTPVFFALIALELLWGWRVGRLGYRLNDAITSIGLGVMSQVVGVFTRLLRIGVYVAVFEHVALLRWPREAVWALPAALLFYDFCYYWHHRWMHRVRRDVGRARRPPLERGLQPVDRAAPDQLRRIARLDPLPADGDPGRAAGAVRHRRADRPAVPVLGAHRAHRPAGLVRPRVRVPVEPPRAPRGQRPLPGPQLRRHPDPVDRLFGTFVDERADEPVVYGTRRPLRSFDPVWANLEVYAQLARDSLRTRRWRDKLLLWLKPPGWRPADLAASDTGPPFALADVRRHDPEIRPAVAGYALAQFAIQLGCAVHFLQVQRTAPTAQTAAYLVWIVVSLVGIGGLLDARRGHCAIEVARNAAAAVGVVLAGQWFGTAALPPAALAAMAAVFAGSALAAAWLGRTDLGAPTAHGLGSGPTRAAS